MVAGDDQTLSGDDGVRLALSGESLEVSTARRVTEQVFIGTRTTERLESIDIELQHESYDIERVAIGRAITEVPATRQEGDVTIIPVIAEEIVIQRRLILKEEIRVRKVVRLERHLEDVALRSQHVEIRRVPVTEPSQTNSENSDVE